MKKALPLLLTALLAACGGGNDDAAVASSQPATPAPSSPAPSSAPIPTPDTTTPTTTPASTVTAAESTFLSESVQSGTAIVQQAQAALQRSSNEDVRRFAQLLIDNHNQLNTSLAQLAQANNVTLPASATSSGATGTAGATGSTSTTGTTAGTQNTTTGNSATTIGATPSANPTGTTSNEELDRLYLQQSLQQQRQYVTRFNEQANGATNAQIKAFALNTLPLLQLQLLTAKELDASIDPAAYLVGSYEDGLGEISLANLALEKSQVEAVRSYAQMMIAHHTELNQQIAAIAQARNLTLPQAGTLPVEHAVPRESLAQLSGADFNKAYMSQNVIVHLGDVGATQAQSTSGTDTEVRNLATASLPRLQAHLQEATDLHASIQPSFLAAAFQSNVNEILLATLATPQRATNEAVRRYAQHMVEDHGKQNTAVAQLAGQENVVLPTKVLPAEGVIAYRTLLPKSGDDFNRTYTAENVRLHEVAVALFTDRAANESDPEQKAFATANLPVLTAHLQEAAQLNDSLPAATTPTGTTDPAAGAGATTPGADTSTPAAGTTTPPAGSGTPAGSTTPGTDASTPAAGTTTPTAGSGTPTADASTPAAGTTTPSAGTTTPGAGSTTPTADTSTPAAGTPAPAPDPTAPTAPTADTTTPTAGATTPPPDATTPAAGAATPAAGAATPTPDPTTPDAGTATPTAGAAAPAAGT
ncbi:DUF4142 domain-containing protein [Noviherbaspirillum malthae]|uniref:DUF4142 domain-containing protein n=1 Tax=Noviherbaspirillum malthae TaxID=1260987 RepID=UPI0018905356|nr:DUF4142 domain-containing protein [Noviherbaspirillum malthae]